jgi:hypothetical protein
MTALADVKALAPNAAAKAAIAAKAHDYASMQNLAIQKAAELKVIVSQMISLHPAAGDSTTLTNLNTLLAELA